VNRKTAINIKKIISGARKRNFLCEGDLKEPNKVKIINTINGSTKPKLSSLKKIVGKTLKISG
jgi:hypothetical protein